MMDPYQSVSCSSHARGFQSRYRIRAAAVCAQPRSKSRWTMVEMVEVDRRPAAVGAAPNGHAVDAIESGDVLYLPHDAFAMTNRERVFLDPAIVKQPRRHSGRARIIYLPA